MIDSTPPQQPAPVILEILSGDALGLSQAARTLPPHRGTANSAHPTCIWRWIVEGATAPDGTPVKLEAARLVGRWLTSRAALARFFAKLTPSTDAVPTPQPMSSRSEKQHQRATEAAKRRLIAAGA